MFTHYRTAGIVLKRIDRGEADQLLVVYTENFGRVEIVARGIRRGVSKLRPAVEFPGIVEIEFIQGKACKTLTDAVSINSLGGTRKDLQKSSVLRQICDFMERAVRDQQDDRRIWDLLVSAVKFLDASAGHQAAAVYHYFVWHLFRDCGWRPSFDKDKIDAEIFTLVNFFNWRFARIAC
ncbi:MAG: DNA repair protein RecO [Candidatus Pacebacteria bacterium]|nr:DNA repair protein RecO [Candidatus Paceibacterota bacterium]